MASHRQDGRPVNEVLASSFPAASLFKIVTAAAAVENGQVHSDTTLNYDGGKWSLDQKSVNKGLTDGRNRATLETSFAYSINTVFGKLGAFTLGPQELESFARKFQFNQEIGFEMPVETSTFDTGAEADFFRLAQLASGLNKSTKCSPIHGAMMAAAVINDGYLMEPALVREVFDTDNRIYYRMAPVPLGRVVKENTVKELQKLMRATIAQGTGRKRFSDARSHPVLSRLTLGGKSGHITDEEKHWVDWFVGFAKDKKGDDSIAVAAVVVHGAVHGIQAQEIVRGTVLRYFSNRLED